MSRKGLLFSIFAISLASLSIFIFPSISENSKTFAQMKQNKTVTMEKYQEDWNSTEIKHTTKPNLEYIEGEIVATLTIPKMDIYELPIYYGANPVNNNWRITTPGHIGNYSMFGEPGVSCVGAHNYQLFKNLEVLEPGDKLIVETSIDRYVYSVESIDIFDHTKDIWNTLATQHENEFALNLMTCYPFDATKTKDMYIVYTSIQKGTVFDLN